MVTWLPVWHAVVQGKEVCRLQHLNQGITCSVCWGVLSPLANVVAGCAGRAYTTVEVAHNKGSAKLLKALDICL
jgi:hypothetical protein